VIRLPSIRGLVLATVAGAGVASAQTPEARRLSLEEALGLARPASEAVAIAKVGIDRARGDVFRARSELFPQLNGSLRYNRQIKSQFDNLLTATTPDTTTRPTSCPAFHPDPNKPFDERVQDLETAVTCATTVNPFAGFSRLPFGRKNTYTLGLTGSQTLFDGGRIFGQMRAAEAGRRSAEVALTSAEAQLVLDVVQAYYDAALSDRLVAIAEATLAQADTTFRQTRLRREVGTAPEFDVLRASVARDVQVPIALQARTQRDLAYTRLKQLLDLPVEQDLTLTTELADTAVANVPTLVRLTGAVPDTAAEHRASVRQAAEAIRAQEGLNRASRAQRLPSVSLTSSYSRLAYPSGGLPNWNEFLTDWSVALGVQVPIFTGGRIKGDRYTARANLEEAKLRHRQALKAAQLDARSALDQLQSAIANWQASEGTSAQANRAYQIADIRFREGISTQTELLDARIALQQAEVNRAQAARDLQIARVRVALLPDLPLGGLPAATTPSSTTTPSRPQPTPVQTTTQTNPTGQPQ
jgi:outer membrane protein TolC